MVNHLHYFPCINSFAFLVQQEQQILDLASFFKRASFRNRTIIASGNGPLSLTIPVVGGRSIKLPYKEVRIDYKSNWQQIHFKSLNTAYGNSPYFIFYKDDLSAIYNKKPVYLFEWNIICLAWVMSKLKLESNIFLIKEMDQLSEHIICPVEYFPNHYADSINKGQPKYQQVFEDRTGFLPNLSVLDLLFNQGLQAKDHLFNISSKLPINSGV